MAMLCMWNVLAQTNHEIQDNSPSMTLSKLPFEMILVPKEKCKVISQHCYHGYTMTHARPFTSNDEASYQINGKITTSKGRGKEHLRPFE